MFLSDKMETNNLISKEKDEKNQIKSDTKYENIKADYFLVKVFNNLEKKKILTIVKYNKNIKNRINININDYKEYSEKYSSIEIEIKPVKNKYGQFINFKDEDKKYYHIYFNNHEEEINRNYINENEEIKIIKIIIDYQIKSFEQLFKNCNCIESIYFKKFYRNNISNMRCMFYSCSSLKELNLNNFNTDNVTDMAGMFLECSSLKELNLNHFNINHVTNMSSMFIGCSSLKELILNNANTNNVKNMCHMFNHCSKELIMKIKNQYKNLREESFYYSNN